MAQPGEAVLVPAAVGFKPKTSQNFAAQVNHSVARVSTPPPCVTGRWLNGAPVNLLAKARIDMRNNITATDATSAGGVTTVAAVVCAGSSDNIRVGAVVGAAGGLASGSLTCDSYMAFHETIFKLPLFAPPVTEKTGTHSIDIHQKTLVE